MGRSLRRQEQRDRIERSIDADGDEHMDVDFPVTKSIFSIFEVKLVGE